MNAPFPPAGGPDPSAGDEPQLRSLLQTEALRQPPVSADLRAGVDRRVRRHRIQMAVLVAPVVAIVLVGAVLLAPRSTPDATLDTASATATQDGETDAPAPEPAAPTSTDCGTVELGPERLDPETAPIDCFIQAFNAGADAQVVVVAHGPDGGTLTETVTTAPGKQVTVVAEGSLSVQLPDLGFGAGGGLVPSDPEGDGTAEDCGTVTITDATTAESVTAEPMACFVRAITSGNGLSFTIITQDETGTMTADIDVSSSNLVTIAVNGTVTQAVPELTIPSDLTSHLPPNGIGIDELLEMGGAGDFMPHGDGPGN